METMMMIISLFDRDKADNDEDTDDIEEENDIHWWVRELWKWY